MKNENKPSIMEPLQNTQRRHTIALSGQTAANGTIFTILAITAGEGNGWIFEPDVLKNAVPLFEQAQCFVDHLQPNQQGGRSIRDLAGVLTRPVWNDETQGVQCQLNPMGPAADLLRETGHEALSSASLAPKIGFSADLSFLCTGNRVAEILKIHSVDLVMSPARGGAFIRQAERARQSANTKKEALMRARFQENAETQSALCAQLLESALTASQLPAPAQTLICNRFAETCFAPEELTNAIQEQRNVVQALLGKSAVNGMNGTVNGMVSESDQLSIAVDDLLGVRRAGPLASVQSARLSGIRELYTMMTGDVDFHGGFNPHRAQFAGTADLPALLKNALNKLVAQRWEELGASGYHWWKPIVSIEHFNSLQSITGILVGEINLLPSINEGASYTELGVADSAEAGLWTKYGGYIGLTLEMFERDDTLKLRQYPFKLATAGLRRLSSLIGAIFTENAGVGPKMADGKNVFDAAAHHNLGTAALTGEAWEQASAAIYHQPLLTPTGGTTPMQAVDARYLIVPRGLRLAAQRILYPAMAWEPNITSENMQRGQLGDVITCPEFTDANDWAAVADPRLVPAIYVGERFGLLPEIYIADNPLHGALFTNDEVRIKARHFLSVFVADHRPLYKSNPA